MKNLKKGFTVAETLIALLIIGVVASLTIPMMSKAIQNRANMATLARTFNQIELGCQNLLDYENSTRTDGSVITILTKIEGISAAKLAPYIDLLPTDESPDRIIEYKEYAYLPTYTLMQSAYAAVLDEESDVDCVQDCIVNGFAEIQCKAKCNGTPATSPPEGSITVCDSNGYCSKCSDQNGDGICDDSTLQGGPIILDPEPDVPVEPEPEDPVEPEPDVKITPIIFKSGSGKATVIFASGFDATKTGADDAIVEELVIDTNGIKNNPNMYGKDAFSFKLLNNGKLEPFGKNSYTTECADGNIKDGKACTARVIADGWKIKY